MADEALVLDVHAFADEAVAADFAAASDAGVLLHLDEGADAGLVTDFAAVEVHEGMDDHVPAEADIIGDAAILAAHRVIRPPWALMLRWAASKMRTMRRPAAPSVKGVRCWSTHSMK